MRAIPDSEIHESVRTTAYNRLAPMDAAAMQTATEIADAVVAELKGTNVCSVIDCDEEVRKFTPTGGGAEQFGCPAHDDE